MRNKNWSQVELIRYAAFASLIVGAVFYLFYYSPVNYSLLIAEDHIGEYWTSVSFGLAGCMLLFMSFKHESGVRRSMWMLMGVALLILAAEEISWGQRIFNIDTPEILKEQNINREISLHNLAAVHSDVQHVIASYLILIYLFFSLVVQSLKPHLEEKLAAFGLPLIKIKMFPLFLLAPFFFIVYPAVYPTRLAGEVGEFILGTAVLIWTVDLCLASIKSKGSYGFSSLVTMVMVFLLTAVISGGLAYRSSFEITAERERATTLNTIALDYIDLEMYDQAESVYGYIYKNSQYLNNSSRIDHARMLLSIDKKVEAFETLRVAAGTFEARAQSKLPTGSLLRNLGITYILLEEDEISEDYFDKSIEIDRRKLDLSSNPDEKANILWSISKTMEGRGDLPAAISYAEQAIQTAESPRLHFKFGKALKVLESL